MLRMHYIRRFDELGRGDIESAGGKGANLGELTRAGLPVPPGFVLTTDAYREFVAATGIGAQVLALAALPPDADPTAYDEPSARIRELFASGAVPEPIANEVLEARASLGEAVAVRSSATAEDLEGASFAGQQDTYLDIRGTDALIAAVRDCWASLWTARAMAYRSREKIDPATVALAVVVQQMVDADAAGVMFTANPTNGRRDEAVISAAWGLGEAVVSGSVTTDDVVVEKVSGRVRARTTADKTVMTVATGGGTEDRPVPALQRNSASLNDAGAAALAELGGRIEAHFGAPQDIEWARVGSEFWIVQARPITALPLPEDDAPTEWPIPDPKAYYFRASIVEQLPDPLTPLFADLIDGSVSRSLQAMFREMLGIDGAVPDGAIRMPTINGYAYYEYHRAAFTRLTLGSPAAMKAVFGGKVSPQQRWRDGYHPRYVQLVERWAVRPIAELSTPELMTGAGELLDGGTEYYTSVQAIIPIAASSEVIFTQFYDRFVRRSGDPAASTFLLGYDSAPIRAERSLYALATWTRTHDELAVALLTAPPGPVDNRPVGVDAAVWEEWSAKFRTHLEHFGHTVYNLDFANAVPADEPGPLLETLRFYLRGGGADPDERQRGSAERRDAATTAVLARLDPVRRATFLRLLRWAQGSAPVREDALAAVGLAWPLLRRMLREIGARLAAAHVINSTDDVFWLLRDEILESADAGPGARLTDVVDQRKARWRGQRRATPPQLLPQSMFMKAFEGFMPATSADQTGNVLKGTGASVGQVTAPARVLSGPQDFGRMQPGDVLVASITTPAWTSLFAMASAVVTDIGGPLSHSSIVAREYGIPAVLGTAVATKRIADGASVRVDGDAGTVTLLDEPAAASPDPERGRPGVAIALAGGTALGLAWLLRRRWTRRRG